MTLYVGNISFNVSSDELKGAFSQFGEVESANIIIDKESGRSKGFGFVTMADKKSGNDAINGMNGVMLRGRELRVNEARPRNL